MALDFSAQFSQLTDDSAEPARSIPAQLYRPFHETEPYAGVRVSRGIPYGDDPRQRFDVFEAEEAATEDPLTLVFVHGGGFVSGDRRLEWPMYYDNIGLWAARHGMTGVTMSYRLAPEHGWPAGAEDVAGVIARLQADAKASGRSAPRIVFAGHSAGATHVACAIARGSEMAGAILLSGGYEVALNPVPPRLAYFGQDASLFAERSPLAALVSISIPLFIGYTEFDSPRAQSEAVNLMDAMWRERGRLIPSICLPGHNHWSQLFQINAAGVDTSFSDVLLAFMRSL